MQPLTKLEKGIFVKIDPIQLEILSEEHKGFLPLDAYPDKYKELAVAGEVGRFMIFRLILEE